MVRAAEIDDLKQLAELAILMWTKHSVEDLIGEFSKIITNGESQFFLKYENGLPVGFAQCSYGTIM